MRILITCGIFEPDAGGPATYAPQVAKELIARGVDVEVLALSDKASYEFDKDYGFKLTRIVRKGKLSNYVRMFFILLKRIKDYDLVYTLDWLAVGLPLSLASLARRKKFIIRIGGGYIWERHLLIGGEPVSLRVFYERGMHKKYPVFFYLIRFVFKRADRIIFNSIKQKELFRKYYGLKPERLKTVFNPVPSDVKPADRDSVTNEILFAGRFITMKNITNLLKGFKKANLPNYKLILLGDGPTLENMKALSQELGLKDSVEFMPRMRKLEVFQKYRNVRYIAIPSWTDIQPMQFYESIAAGIPVLLTKENYLAESDQLSVHIDPHSHEDIGEKMVYLSDENNYRAFSESFASIKVSRGWSEVADLHMEIFIEISTKS